MAHKSLVDVPMFESFHVRNGFNQKNRDSIAPPVAHMAREKMLALTAGDSVTFDRWTFKVVDVIRVQRRGVCAVVKVKSGKLYWIGWEHFALAYNGVEVSYGSKYKSK